MISFTSEEKKFLESMEECRIATSHDDIPHVKPVSYIFESESFWIATDYDTRMYENVKSNSRAALSIDIYKSGSHKAICVQGTVSIIENGQEFQRIYEIFHKKFEWVRKEPWIENEAPFIRIKPFSKSSWGIE